MHVCMHMSPHACVCNVYMYCMCKCVNYHHNEIAGSSLLNVAVNIDIIGYCQAMFRQ